MAEPPGASPLPSAPPPPLPWSLRRRLAGALIAACLFIGMLALWDTRGEALRTARDVSDRVLEGSAMAIAEQITLDADGTLSVAIPFSALDMLSSAAQDQVFYRVDGPEGFLTGYDSLSLAPVPPGADVGFADDLWRGTAIRKATLLRELTGGDALLPVAITVAESTHARERLAAGILSRSALRIAVLIVGATLVAFLVVTLALRPLADLSRQLAQRRPEDLKAVAGSSVRELQPVVEALNAFLSRLHVAVTALRNFSSNANHQIRTPIAVARTQISLAQRATDRAARDQALSEAELALIRTERVLAKLLRLAQLQSTGDSLTRAAFDLSRAMRGMTAEYIPLALEAGIDLGFEGAENLRVVSDEDLVVEMFGNIVDNAIKHGVAGCAITVAVGLSDGHVCASVTSEGPALEPAVFDTIAKAIEDKDRPVRMRASMHGLGLQIISEISQALGIELTVSQLRDEYRLRLSARF